MSDIIHFRNLTAIFQRTSRLLRPERVLLWAFLSQNFNTDETKVFFLKVFRGFIILKQWNFNFLLIPNRQASNRSISLTRPPTIPIVSNFRPKKSVTLLKKGETTDALIN